MVNSNITVQVGVVVGCLSVIGSLIIILSYILFPRLRTHARQLVCWLSLADLFQALFFVLSEWIVPAKQNTACWLLGLFGVFSSVSTFMWTTCIAYFVLDNLRHLRRIGEARTAARATGNSVQESSSLLHSAHSQYHAKYPDVQTHASDAPRVDLRSPTRTPGASVSKSSSVAGGSGRHTDGPQPSNWLRMLVCFHVLSWGVPLGVCAFVWYSVRSGSLYTSDDTWCFVPEKYTITRLMANLVPMFLCWTVTACLYLWSIMTIRNITSATALQGEIRTKLLLIPFFFVVLRLPDAVYRSVELITASTGTHSPSYFPSALVWLLPVVSCGNAAQGTVDCVIYVFATKQCRHEFMSLFRRLFGRCGVPDGGASGDGSGRDERKRAHDPILLET
eukprot:TRINITY_DN7437_c0_g1_i1.p1 TRINITY_DN7437_c0_g1~~TRINITY_DN7437_c0_g1_i1.p1  ORF type:complete len:391 (+),score=44.41 TRINITY_DN7437_c0_g1_i1:232-1404(+)